MDLYTSAPRLRLQRCSTLQRRQAGTSACRETIMACVAGGGRRAVTVAYRPRLLPSQLPLVPPLPQPRQHMGKVRTSEVLWCRTIKISNYQPLWAGS